MEPVWVALLAPAPAQTCTEGLSTSPRRRRRRPRGDRRCRLACCWGGHPPLGGRRGGRGSPPAGRYAFLQLAGEGIRRRMDSVSIVTIELTLDSIVILPLADLDGCCVGRWRSPNGHRRGGDPRPGCTAVAYSIGGRRASRASACNTVPSSGLLSPVVAPLVRLGAARRGDHAGGRPSAARSSSPQACSSSCSARRKAIWQPSGARRARRDPLGYAIVVVSYLGMAGSAPLAAWAGAPEAIILCLRMAFAALALGVVFLRARCSPTGVGRRRLAAAGDGGDVVAHAAAVLLRRPPHQRRHRHVPAVPDAGVGGARGTQALQVAA